MTTVKYTLEVPEFQSEEISRTLLAALAEEAREIEKQLKRTTRTGSHKPAFQTTSGREGDDYYGESVTTDDKYRWVNDGTKARTIVPRRGKYLRFRSKFTPKTRPGVIGSRGGARTGPWTVVPIVHHKGIKPRNFTPTIVRLREKRFAAKIESIMDRYG